MVASPTLKFTLLAFLTLIVGCGRGPQVAPVDGRVTLDGKPLETAEVTFEPQAGRASHGLTDTSGHYDLRYTRDQMGALLGSHTVRITSATEVTLPSGKFVLRPQMVPPRYNAHSELRKEVTAGGDNHCDFDLTSNGK